MGCLPILKRQFEGVKVLINSVLMVYLFYLPCFIVRFFTHFDGLFDGLFDCLMPKTAPKCKNAPKA